MRSRRRIIPYVIAADLVVVATGVGLLSPSNSGLLLAVFMAAVVLAARKGTWRSGMLALALSTALLGLLFPDGVDGTYLIGFLIVGLITTAIIGVVRPPQDQAKVVQLAEPPSGSVVAFDRSSIPGAAAHLRETNDGEKAIGRPAAEQREPKREDRKTPSPLAADEPDGVSSSTAQPRTTKR